MTMYYNNRLNGKKGRKDRGGGNDIQIVRLEIILYNSMQSPVKLNKINPKLSGSRREEKSYA